MVGEWHGVADGISIEAGVGFSPHAFCISSGCPVCFPSPYTPTDRDADWIARELGDVPVETPTGWRNASGTRIPFANDTMAHQVLHEGYVPKPYPWGIPVESLGREA